MKRLPDVELEVMQAVWQCKPPVMRKDIEKIINEIHPMAETTLLTILTRLSEKGFIRIEKKGRRSEYEPLIERKDYQKSESKSFIDRVFSGNISAFAAALCDSGISEEDLEQLKELLRKGKI